MMGAEMGWTTSANICEDSWLHQAHSSARLGHSVTGVSL